MNDNDINLQPLWQELKEIYKQFAAICVRHKLRYFVLYGSALGAVRHHGFIPWDDDFDVGMPREDYEKFFLIATEELPTPYKVVCGVNDIGWLPFFGKVYNSDDNIRRNIELSGNSRVQYPPYIDVFPLDGCPESFLGFHYWRMRRFMLRAVEIYRFPTYAGPSLHWGIARFVGRLISVFYTKTLTYDELVGLYSKLASELPYEESRYVANNTYMPVRKKMPRNWFIDSVEMKFDELRVPIPKDYHAYLSLQYGEYMTPPPAELRRPAHQ